MSMAIGGGAGLGVGLGAGLGAGAGMKLGDAGPMAGGKGPQAPKATKDLQAKSLQARDPKAAKGQQLAKGPQGPGANEKPQSLNRTQAKDLKDPTKAQAKDLKDPARVQDQNKAHGADFGRNGALSRGQGFSQRDSFEAAQKKDQPGASRAQDPQGGNGVHSRAMQDPVAQGQQVRQTAQADAVKRAQQDQEARIARMMQDAADAAMMRMAYMGPLDENIRETIKKMWKKFLEWLKEMDEIFLKPAPR